MGECVERLFTLVDIVEKVCSSCSYFRVFLHILLGSQSSQISKLYQLKPRITKIELIDVYVLGLYFRYSLLKDQRVQKINEQVRTILTRLDTERDLRNLNLDIHHEGIQKNKDDKR
eukprot:TRINITY_DN17000_c0_g1_i1.p12 TRINITY_DN17000_c0_g1~~TRINITY_DN17000_c0_g1_i1.p12  ORF type:complete len:116 (+),score=3.54 TRINITY_DN17000_c0_g1_i1:988-1335(+)